MKFYTITILLEFYICILTVNSACMRMEIMHKSREQKNYLTHTHKTQDMLSGKPFWEKTKLECEVVSLSFSV